MTDRGEEKLRAGRGKDKTIKQYRQELGKEDGKLDPTKGLEQGKLSLWSMNYIGSMGN